MELFNQFLLFSILLLAVNGLSARAGVNQSNNKGMVVGEETINVSQNIEVKDTSALLEALSKVTPGQTILLADGVYQDIKLISKVAGTDTNPITIKAIHPGKAIISGDSKVELWGNYTILEGLYFKEGNRNPNSWRTHGPGLVAIYGDHCRVTQCLFFNFDHADSAYITTSLDKTERVPKYGRIDHCAFIEKTTFDQVINLNNKLRKNVNEVTHGEPMFHRIDHCYFCNPQKKGNAGGGIRIGYWRTALGQCLVDSNYFERQDSEAEIVTSKSQQNVYYNNVFKHCQGTLNFRHGDYQVAIANYFVATDTKHEYGGMFVWGSGHLIAKNSFLLVYTLKSRGHACIYFNPGPAGSEHALAYDISCVGNTFDSPSGYNIHLAPLYDRRLKSFKDKTERPHDIRFVGNKFVANKEGEYPIVADPFEEVCKQTWIQNKFTGSFTNKQVDSKSVQAEDYQVVKAKYAEVQFIDKYIGDHPVFDFLKTEIKYPLGLMEMCQMDAPDVEYLYRKVGPTWVKEFPGTYAKTGKWKLITRSKRG